MEKNVAGVSVSLLIISSLVLSQSRVDGPYLHRVSLAGMTVAGPH